ncbi:hypothetical protein ASZ90_018419 [hydrocarbon metagenome]|uniref:Uncharacterized protein n=1 Tax=hydrocarbon metagenome TaxID=938273 RepID=A0A0W8E6D9_9ZZZZ
MIVSMRPLEALNKKPGVLIQSSICANLPDLLEAVKEPDTIKAGMVSARVYRQG